MKQVEMMTLWRGKQKCTQNFHSTASWKETAWYKWEYRIKMDWGNHSIHL